MQPTYDPAAHPNADRLVSLSLAGQAEATGVNDSHPYWSLDRREFIAAGDLRSGERVDTLSGETTVESVVPLDYTGLVYNLETTEHVYRVDTLGTLVHNNNVCKVDIAPSSVSKSEYARLRKQTPSYAIREAVNPPGRRIDPIYGNVVARLEADHIVPMKQIVTMPGFSRLSEADKVAVLNLRENFMGLSKASNASKGAKTYAEWKGHSKLGPIPDDIRAWLKQVEQDAAKSLANAIAQRLGG